MKPVLNKVIPTRTPKERYQATPEKFIERAKKRYVIKSNEILQQRKKYYEENKEKFARKYKDKKAQKENNLFITEFQNFTIV